MPLLIICIPILAVPLILLSGEKHRNVREGWTLLAAACMFGVLISVFQQVMAHDYLYTHLGNILPGIGFYFLIDKSGYLFALLASGLWLLTSIYSIGYMRSLNMSRQTRYYSFFALSLAATMGIAFAGNLLTFVVCFELLTLATYPLVTHKENAEALAAGRKYLIYTLGGGLSLLIGIAIIYASTESLAFMPGGFVSTQNMSLKLAAWAFGLMVLGVGVKAAIMPLHAWLPSAMVAPSPVSALLHAVAVVKAGAFGVIRISAYVFDADLINSLPVYPVLIALTLITIVVASLLALGEDHLKRRLAYSTIGHLSYIALGALLNSPLAMAAALLHLVNHALMKITLFFCAGAIQAQSGKTRVSQLDGIGYHMPWTMGAFALASVGLAGLPPMNGFFSKFLLAQASAASDYPIAMYVLLLSGLLNAAYFFPIVYRAFKTPTQEDISEAPLTMRVPLIITSFSCFVLGIFYFMNLDKLQGWLIQ